MSTTPTSVIVIGGGIVGLAVANELTTAGHHVRVLEKEAAVAAHQPRWRSPEACGLFADYLRPRWPKTRSNLGKREN